MKGLRFAYKNAKYVAVMLFLMGLSSTAQNTIHSGEGTFYAGVAGSTAGNCSIYVAAEDYKHCALNTIDYDNATACGGYIRVNGAKGSVVLQVVDRCPECKKGDVDMTEEAFAMIDDVVKGRVPITWHYVENPNATPIKIKFKEGSSQYWTAIQLFDIRYAIASLAYLDAEDNWIPMQRELYNFFVAPNGIASPMQLRAIDVNGTAIIFKDISITPEVVDTSQQFSEHVLHRKAPEARPLNGIFPNPTKAKVSIKGAAAKQWQLLDVQSRVLATGQSLEVDLSAYNQGVYFLNVMEDKRSYRIVKE